MLDQAGAFSPVPQVALTAQAGRSATIPAGAVVS